MKEFVLCCLLLCMVGSIRAQSEGTSTGRISYKSSQNIYVKFESTKNIKPGDTLYMPRKDVLVPILVVTNQSSTSCVCVPISTIDLPVSMPVMAKIRSGDNVDKPMPVDVQNEVLRNDTLITNPVGEKASKSVATAQKQNVSGSIAATSYSNFSNTESADLNRFQYTLALNARNVADSRFSFDSYLTFRHVQGQWAAVHDNVFQALKVYGLSVGYNDGKNNQLVLGRKINHKISSIGAVDGLQYERKLNDFSLGAFVGARPNYSDYSIDFSLPQFGAYFSHSFTNNVGEMANTFAVVEQMNSTKTDRRFAYFQHSNALLKNVYLFGSVEVDLYKMLNGKQTNTFNLSSTYVSLGYRPSKKIAFSTSYDSRKNVIYYETYKNYINQLIDIEARQGLSFTTNYYTLRNLSMGVRAGYCFKNSNASESRNLYGYVTYSNMPWLKLTSTLSVNYLETGYMDGQLLNLNLARDLFNGKLYADCGYQFVDYSVGQASDKLVQHIGNIGLNWRFCHRCSFAVDFERTFENAERYNRLVFQIRKRF